MPHNPQSLFITGATGTLGKEMVALLLRETPHKLHLLIRSKNKVSAGERLGKLFSPYGLEREFETRVRVWEGDVVEPGLGLKAEDYAEISEEVDQVFHIAALTALNGSRENCFRMNLGGTEEMLRFADRAHREGRLKRFFYFSTAYAVGSLQTFCSKEDALPEKPAHANYYEASKYAAESKVREAMQAGLPVTIFRPSIVVGDSQTGKVSEFNVIYPFMKLFAHGLLTKIPTRLDNSFNIVPIDFVIQASLAIARREDSVGKTFHLVTQDPPSMATLFCLKEKEFPQLPPIEIVDPEAFQKEHLSPDEQIAYGMLAPYLGYLNHDLTFDTQNTERFLAGTGIHFPKTDYQFLCTLIRYAVDVGYLIV